MSGSLTTEQLARVAELERRLVSARLATVPLSLEEAKELAALRDIARALTGPAELADDPRTLADEARRPLLTGSDDPSTPEDESDFLGLMLSKSAREREAACLRLLNQALRLLEPIALAALQGALTRGIAALPVPPELLPVVRLVETTAMDAARAAVGDVRP